MEMKNVMDVSRFFLFEATGDSDVIMGEEDDDVGQDNAMADDDAESCSYDSSDSKSYVHHDEEEEEEEEEDEDDDDEEDDDDDEDDDDEGNSNQTCKWDGREHMEKQRGRLKSSVSVDSSKELMNEKEKSRRFWEACLAS